MLCNGCLGNADVNDFWEMTLGTILGNNMLGGNAKDNLARNALMPR